MRVLLWHGWLLEGTGSNVYTARVAEELAARGHDVLLLCQERRPERYRWIDAVGTIGADGVSELVPNGDGGHAGRCVLLRPEIGHLLPVFVLDEYEGFDVARFVDLTDAELDRYLVRNADALHAALGWHRSELVIAGHAIPGAVVAERALGHGRFVTKIHGSDLEYAIRLQARYRRLGRQGLLASAAVAGSSSDVLKRCEDLVPGIAPRAHVVHPGVAAERFRPRPRDEALEDLAARLDADAETERGRRSSLDDDVRDASRAGDLETLDALARTYDQTVPDPDAAARLRELSAATPIVGYFGKLIPQKGVPLLLAALTRSTVRSTALVVGFGLARERIAALALALEGGDLPTIEWLVEAAGAPLVTSDLGSLPLRSSVVFTGRLDHRYAPDALAAMDVVVVPSILDEAFGMVAVEAAAAGALPLVARHSGLAEVAGAIERHVGRPGLLSFQPGRGAVARLAEGIDRLLGMPMPERVALRDEVRRFTAEMWSWRRTSGRLLELAAALRPAGAATAPPGAGPSGGSPR